MIPGNYPGGDMTEIVTTTEPTAASTTRRVIGQDAIAALAERHADAQREIVLFGFRGTDYRLLVPTPAPILLHLARSSEDMGEIIRAIQSCFHDDDADAFINELMRTDVDVPADMIFINELLGAILEGTTSRPESS